MRTPGAAITDSVTQNAMIGEGGVDLAFFNIEHIMTQCWILGNLSS